MPKHFKNRFLLVKDYLSRKEKVSGLPIEFSIELTNYCNSKCIMCPRQYMKRKKGFMEFSTFKKIIDELKDYAEFCYLHLAGDPLMHPKFDEFVKYAKSSGLNIGFSTNAILLNEENTKKILDSGLDFLTISIDGVNKETFKKIKGVDVFDKVIENTCSFLEQKKRSSNKKPFTAVQLIYIKENKDEAKLFVKKWKNLADVVRIKPFLNFAGSVDNNLLAINKKTRRKPCFLLWRQLAIYWDGSVVVCCLDFLSKTILGNVKDASIKELWNSQFIKDLRLGKIIGEKNICENCTMPNIGLPFLIGGIFLNAYLSKKILIFIEKISLLKGLKLGYET